MTERIPADGNIDVVLTLDLETAKASGLQLPYVAVTPDKDNWDDYGHRLFAKLYLIEGHEPEQVHEIFFYIMFEELSDTYDALKAMLVEGAAIDIAGVKPTFASLIPDVSDYGKLISTLGFERGITALRKLGDVAVARFEGSPEKVVQLSYTEAFVVGVLRRWGSVHAIRRGARHFSPLPAPQVGEAASRSVFQVRIQSADNIAEFTLDFSEKPLIRDRISVLVGPNGVGKTQILNAMVRSMVQGDFEKTGTFSPPLASSRVLVFSSVPSDPYPRSIGAWRGIDYDYFAVNAEENVSQKSFMEALVACRFEDMNDLFVDGEGVSRLKTLERLLGRLGLWEHLYLPVVPEAEDKESVHSVVLSGGQRFVHVGARYRERDQLRLLSLLDWERQPVILNAEYETRALSSGEHAMLRFAVQATAAIETGSLVLLDEPETHLHPNYVSDLMEILYELLEATNSVAVIATHSAYVVREVSRENVNVVSVEKRSLTINKPRLQTFGASVDSISQFIFGDTQFEHRFETVLVDWAKRKGAGIGLEEIIARYGSRLNSESLSLIASVLDEESDVADE